MAGRWTTCIGAVAIAGVVAGCGVPLDGSGTSVQPGTERGPVSLVGAGDVEIWGDPDRVAVPVPSCNGDPEAVRVEEDEDAVRIEVVTTQPVSGEGPDCRDVLDVPLERPLGDRAVIDLVSGAALPVLTEEQILLECQEADYDLEPTHPTPEEALEAELRLRPASAAVPDDLDAYVRTDRDDRTVAFEHVVDDHTESTWLVVQDDDGRWGIVSLSACEPAS